MFLFFVLFLYIGSCSARATSSSMDASLQRTENPRTFFAQCYRNIDGKHGMRHMKSRYLKKDTKLMMAHDNEVSAHEVQPIVQI